MNAMNIGDIFSEALFIVVLMVSVIIVPSLLVGLIVATFQAATQINEQTLSFLPRLLVTLLMMLVSGPYLIGKLVDYVNNIFLNIPLMIG
ncbi:MULTISPECIES: flagellar biosynthetic protein FliQ [Reinekea]|jgi:flagellar biosynthetic protein FliQ|uniref:Flagellar biosynthesis protein FliQ n=1 Tax=Reinekea forsetii TaxID=1336806 RepID=A0A2K8KUX6_9GAMM|nr:MULTISPECIES: flagellar biosynthetic protein FliQ [Reinekea]ATX76676.1 flagellar biosynthesis protein FliQ [Reinekea forsetii]MDB9894769.1 flagellar biosynthetic protein FliQ [Reinekea forsetii]MDO7640916.1 flagellar biosynthetic protein FliQ [Reinekea forsetii]MDO7645563.1 flagellar biosynthetic protein FliQ [Reinekea forsetii]